MLGSISKVRPCGHHHYYKYAHAKNTKELRAIHAKYPDDHMDGIWEFSINNFERPSGTVSNWQGGDEGGTFQSNKNIVTLKISAPNIVYCNGLCYGMSNLENCIFDDVDNEKVYQLTCMFMGCKKLKYISESFNPNPEKMSKSGSWWIFRDCGEQLILNNNLTFPYYEWFDKIYGDTSDSVITFSTGYANNKFSYILDDRYSFKNCSSIGFGHGDWSAGIDAGMSKVPDNLSLKNCNNFGITSQYLTEFHTVDTMEKCKKFTVTHANKLRDLYKDSESFSFPAMKTLSLGGGMGRCPLNARSVINLCESLPTWTDGKSKNTFSVQIHNDNYYNPEVSMALKRIDKDYITPYEQMGGVLPEEVTEDKGWTIKSFTAVNSWGPISLLDEYLQPSILEEIDYSVSLPEGYQRCKWLKSVPNEIQWIETQCVPTEETGFYCISKCWSSGETPMGDTYSAGINVAWINNGNWCVRYRTLSHYQTYWYSGRTCIGKTNWLNDKKWNLMVPELTKNGDLPAFSSKNLPIKLFNTIYDTTSATGGQFKGYIYRAKISEGEEIVMDFVPCLNPDGKPCMYDVINGVEYHNQGTGADFDYELYQG